jgi:hypothetical protein
MGGRYSFCCYKNRREGGLRRFGSMPTTRRTITTVPDNTTATLSLSLKTASFCCTHSETKNERKRLAFFFLSLSFLARIYLNREKRKGHVLQHITYKCVYMVVYCDSCFGAAQLGSHQQTRQLGRKTEENK